MSERIIPIWDDLIENLQYAKDIAEQLDLTGTPLNLTSFEVEVIWKPPNTTREVKRKLLGAIQKRGAYDVFAQCLRVTGQDALYQLLVSTGPVQPVTDELSTLQYRVYCKHRIGDPNKIHVPPHIQQLLETQRETLQGMEKVERLVDLLEYEGCLTSEMTREINQKTGDKDKINMLVDHMKELKLHSFFVLAMFLAISQQKDLLITISDVSSMTALRRMDDLRLEVYYNQLGYIALQDSELQTRLGITTREFVTLRINIDSNAVHRRGFNEAHFDLPKGNEIQLQDLFSDQENKIPTKKVLLIGAPGTGKTTAVAQLARDATLRKVLNIPRPPFIILLRSINWWHPTSLKKLLLDHGPILEETEANEVWEALSKHADDVTVILDGADEVPGRFFKPGQVSYKESDALPRDILNNLIQGKLLKGSRVLVSSRPHNLESCWDLFDRKVEVVGFTEESLDRFLSIELPVKIREVQRFLQSHLYIRSLLLIPLHAATFVLHAKNPHHKDDWLVQSRTELSLSLIDTLVKTKLRKDHGGKIPGKNLEEQGDNLRKLCKLIAETLCIEGAIETEMRRKDLKKQITVGDCVATGVFSELVLDDDDVSDCILMVPHQSILEPLAALGLEGQQIIMLVAENDGRHDMVLTYVVGILGNERIRNMLEYVLSGEDQEKDFKKLTEIVVRTVLVSKRRELLGGEEFCQRIMIESQQWGLIAELMGQHMTTGASTSLTYKELYEKEELSGASVTENSWCFEISNETNYLESGSILPYPIEVFVPTGALSMRVHTKLKVNVKQIDNHNDTSLLTGNRQLGPFIQFEADQAHVQFIRPLLVFIKFPEDILKNTDDYEYCVQYNSGKDIHEGMWNDITGYREGEVSGEVIPSHQTAVLLLPHFTWFTIFQRCKMLNVDLYAKHLQLQDTHYVNVTCLVYHKPLYRTSKHKKELKRIEGVFRHSEAMALSKNDRRIDDVRLSSHDYEPWHLIHEDLRTQIIPIQPLLENNIMTRTFSFQGQRQSAFSCYIEAKVPGCTVNPQVLMPLEERPCAEQRNTATRDSVRSVQSQLWQCISPYLQIFTPKERDDLMGKGTRSKFIRNILDSNRVDLLGAIYVNECLWNQLIQNGVLGVQDKDNIKKEYATHDQAIGIIESIRRRTDTYEAFIKSLQGANQGHVVNNYLLPVPRTPHHET